MVQFHTRASLAAVRSRQSSDYWKGFFAIVGVGVADGSGHVTVAGGLHQEMQRVNPRSVDHFNPHASFTPWKELIAESEAMAARAREKQQRIASEIAAEKSRLPEGHREVHEGAVSVGEAVYQSPHFKNVRAGRTIFSQVGTRAIHETR